MSAGNCNCSIIAPPPRVDVLLSSFIASTTYSRPNLSSVSFCDVIDGECALPFMPSSHALAAHTTAVKCVSYMHKYNYQLLPADNDGTIRSLDF